MDLDPWVVFCWVDVGCAVLVAAQRVFALRGDQQACVAVAMQEQGKDTSGLVDVIGWRSGFGCALCDEKSTEAWTTHGGDNSVTGDELERRADFQTKVWRSEVTARTKFPVAAGTVLEGMGGHHVRGWTIDADDAREQNAIPIGIVGGCRLKRDLPAHAIVTYDDVEVDESRPLVAMRRLQDSMLAAGLI